MRSLAQWFPPPWSIASFACAPTTRRKRKHCAWPSRREVHHRRCFVLATERTGELPKVCLLGPRQSAPGRSGTETVPFSASPARAPSTGAGFSTFMKEHRRVRRTFLLMRLQAAEASGSRGESEKTGSRSARRTAWRARAAHEPATPAPRHCSRRTWRA